jgi:hypothetical protein
LLELTVTVDPSEGSHKAAQEQPEQAVTPIAGLRQSEGLPLGGIRR